MSARATKTWTTLGEDSATLGIAYEERGNSASAIHRDWIVFVLESIVVLAILTPAKRVVW
ncbi:MAG: hypothetical protein DMG56_00485 [Acidobacteria bacterium]|nr:MAG: hypothetical protein DMG53_16400 [Acidobacteriota bacterium]PYU66355.1 MAG: hypothetical protein DMG56_00485 [Acidobacteriota bacterium]PYU73270.1 MAG: hypothetical protein DMG52_15915 [Acidobacteriota bacterium]